MSSDKIESGVSRRDLLSHASPAGFGIAAIGSALFIETIRAEAFVLRPPGARQESRFLATCLKCGQCLRACPYEAIHLAGLDRGSIAGTPLIDARTMPCMLCPDLPCITACPSGALDPEVTKVEKVRMGMAVIVDREECLALKGMRCEVCYRICPLIDHAITLEVRRDYAGKAYAVFEPVVHQEKCTGCGKCEHACVLEKPAIRVLQRDWFQV